MKLFLLILASVSFISVSHALERQGHYEVDDSAVITNDTVAQAHCTQENLNIYDVSYATCISAAEKCLARLEMNKINVEANPMYHIRCFAEELNLTMPELLQKYSQ